MNDLIVGYTTGVFDMFHVGHLNILKNSKKHCDYLIVGVTSDETVKLSKGKVPIICLEDRMEIVDAIEYVDQVIVEENTDKLDAYQKINFDVIFKGSDWKGTEKWNYYESEFNKLGVKVIYFDYTDKVSSTKLREELKIVKIK